MKILLTGGLGYIGSHIAHKLSENAIIIDNKVNSSLNYKKFLPKARVYEDDLNYKNLNKIFKNHEIKGVIHLAGLKSVNESIAMPISYYKTNICSSLDLLECMDKFKINKLIFSSSATVYGSQNKPPFKENMTVNAINPYGNTKIIIEQIINDYAKSSKTFRAMSLRYFNPIGRNIDSGLKDKPKGKAQNLMPLLIKAAKENKIFNIYGNDYDTKDGTCVRDYIHVEDIAFAHILALNKLREIKGYTTLNLGMGKGLSVLEVLKIFEKVTKVKIKKKIKNRRSGDVPASYANNKKAISILNWKPLKSYEDMIGDSWLDNSK